MPSSVQVINSCPRAQGWHRLAGGVSHAMFWGGFCLCPLSLGGIAPKWGWKGQHCFQPPQLLWELPPWPGQHRAPGLALSKPWLGPAGPTPHPEARGSLVLGAVPLRCMDVIVHLAGLGCFSELGSVSSSTDCCKIRLVVKPLLCVFIWWHSAAPVLAGCCCGTGNIQDMSEILQTLQSPPALNKMHLCC